MTPNERALLGCIRIQNAVWTELEFPQHIQLREAQYLADQIGSQINPGQLSPEVLAEFIASWETHEERIRSLMESTPVGGSA